MDSKIDTILDRPFSIKIDGAFVKVAPTEFNEKQLDMIGKGEVDACAYCAFNNYSYCSMYSCTPDERSDEKSIYYKTKA